MYHDHFKLTGPPFQITPDARFFFHGRTHGRALSYLTYGLSLGEGFVVVTGEVGAGKTTLLEYLLSTLEANKFRTAKLVSTQLGGDDLLRLIGTTFGLDVGQLDKAAVLTQLQNFFINSNAVDVRPLLIVDEVQNLSMQALEELRMLSNFQVNSQPLVQTFLIGQPQFRDTMASRDLEQLMQRVVAAHHLEPLTADETQAYIEHRLKCVNWAGDPLLDSDIFNTVYAASAGVPRRINLLCDRLFLACFLEDGHTINQALASTVIAELRREGLLRLPANQVTTAPMARSEDLVQ
jgi:putative secretion ATPase (PEP-CTERM system associated)